MIGSLERRADTKKSSTYPLRRPLPRLGSGVRIPSPTPIISDRRPRSAARKEPRGEASELFHLRNMPTGKRGAAIASRLCSGNAAPGFERPARAATRRGEAHVLKTNRRFTIVPRLAARRSRLTPARHLVLRVQGPAWVCHIRDPELPPPRIPVLPRSRRSSPPSPTPAWGGLGMNARKLLEATLGFRSSLVE
jgi:hypothetical protein